MMTAWPRICALRYQKTWRTLSFGRGIRQGRNVIRALEFKGAKMPLRSFSSEGAERGPDTETNKETEKEDPTVLEKVTETVVNTMEEVATVVADTTKTVSETVTEAVEKSKETVDGIVGKGKDIATSVGDVPSVMKEAVETGKEKGLETAVRQMISALQVAVKQLEGSEFKKATVTAGISLMEIVNLSVAIHIEELDKEARPRATDQGDVPSSAQKLDISISSSSKKKNGTLLNHHTDTQEEKKK